MYWSALFVVSCRFSMVPVHSCPTSTPQVTPYTAPRDWTSLPMARSLWPIPATTAWSCTSTSSDRQQVPPMLHLLCRYLRQLWPDLIDIIHLARGTAPIQLPPGGTWLRLLLCRRVEPNLDGATHLLTWSCGIKGRVAKLCLCVILSVLYEELLCSDAS